nr:hypothetical protein CFP56_59981 [Quercus suber]
MLHHKNTFSLKLFPTLSWQLWLHRNGERFGEPGIQATTLVYIVIRDFNENLVAAKVKVIVGQCWLEAHFAGFWHAQQLCKNGDFRRFNLRAT